MGIEMNSPDREGKSFLKHPILVGVAVGSTLVFGGLCFGFLREFTELPLWACLLIAPPAGAATFLLILWLHIYCDTPPR